MAFSAFTAPYTRQEHPQESNTYVLGPFAATQFASADLPLLVLDRDCDLEQVTLRATTAGSVGTMTLKASGSGVDPTGAGTALTSGIAATGLTANTPFIWDLDIATKPHLNLTAGTCLSIVGSTVTGVVGLTVTIRTRTRRFRTTDNSGKQFVDDR